MPGALGRAENVSRETFSAPETVVMPHFAWIFMPGTGKMFHVKHFPHFRVSCKVVMRQVAKWSCAGMFHVKHSIANV